MRKPIYSPTSEHFQGNGEIKEVKVRCILSASEFSSIFIIDLLPENVHRQLCLLMYQLCLLG